MDEDIARLDVPMHDIILDQHLESFEQISEIAQSPFLAQISILFDQAFQSASIAVLIDKVDIIGCLEYLNKLDYMRGVLNLR